MKKIKVVLFFLIVCGCFATFDNNVEAATYTVTYDANRYDYEITAYSSEKKADSTKDYTIISRQPTRTTSSSYYIFKGWSKSASNGTVDYLPGQNIGKVTSDMTLYAVYSSASGFFNTHTVTLKAGGAVYGTLYIGTDCLWSYSINSPKSGYKVVGWSTKENASVEEAEYTSLTAVNGNYIFKGTDDVTLYAVYEPYSFTVQFNVDGTEYATRQTKSGEVIDISGVQPKKDGVHLIGWGTFSTDKEPDYVDTYTGVSSSENGTKPLYAIWGHKISFDLKANANDLYNAPSSVGITVGNSYTLPGKNLMRKDGGGNFLGWSLSPLATSVNLSPGDSFKPEADVTFYAVWDMNQYDITFDDNGGVYGPVSSIKVHATTMTIPNVVPEREGYTFLGWATSASATTPAYKAGSSYTIEGNATLYAVWKKGAVSNDGTTTNPSTLTSQTITASNQSIVYKKNKKVSLKASTNGGGALTYTTSNKKVVTVGKTTGKLTIKGYGKATITIIAAANGNYKKTTKKITVTVTPKKVTLKTAKSPSKKTISASWKKESAASGYIVQFSTSKKFKTGTYERKFAKSKTSMKIKGLKSKKKFYVRVRAYKTVKGKKYYGPWSTVKHVKIK